jgi:hypothetical protein
MRVDVALRLLGFRVALLAQVLRLAVPKPVLLGRALALGAFRALSHLTQINQFCHFNLILRASHLRALPYPGSRRRACFKRRDA